ncbi:MAG: NusA-like transcription termination signal-binding factor [Candidatus Heimdallarchaeota archaeon]
MQRFDTETIRLITLFENITGAPVKDCISDNNTVYFIIEEGKVGMAIGKNGNSVKHAEKIIGKSIKIFEFSEDLVSFVKHLIPKAVGVKIRYEDDKKIVEIEVEKKDRAVVIGRDGKNLNLFKQLLQRTHKINDLVVR